MSWRRTIPVAVIFGVALTGCSQAAQLQPVAGGQISAVRTATNDILEIEKVLDGYLSRYRFDKA